MLKIVFVFLCSLSMISCATAPGVEDYSGFYTLNIVQRIRCEARDAYRLYLQKLTDDRADERFADERVQLFRQALIDGQPLSKARKQALTAGFNKLLDRLDRASIIYDFNFLLTEQNRNGIKTTISDPLRGGVFSVLFDNSAEFKRETQTNFRVIDLFDEFDDESFERRCMKPGFSNAASTGNIFYPVTGKIGLSSRIWEYLMLVQTTGLSAKDGKSLANNSTYIRRLSYTTTLGAGVNPTLELRPATFNTHVSKIEGMFSSSRIDLHEVTIALGLNPENGVPATTSAVDDLNRQQVLDAFQARRGF